MIARKICSTIELGIFKIHYATGHFIPKKHLSLVFYDNRNLKISKSKKSEQYFRDNIEIFICPFHKHFARHFESHWRETWRQAGRRTVPPGGGGYSHTLPIRVCATQRGRDFEAPDLERGIHFRGVF